MNEEQELIRLNYEQVGSIAACLQQCKVAEDEAILIDKDLLDRLLHCIAKHNHKIAAVRLAQQINCTSLRDAKDYVEGLDFNGLTFESTILQIITNEQTTTFATCE